ELISTSPEYLVRWLLLHSTNDHIVDLYRIWNRDNITSAGLQRDGLIIQHPISNILNPSFGEYIERFIRFSQARALPPTRRSTGQFLNRRNRVQNRSALILHAVHRFLDETMPHEVPSCAICRLTGFPINFAT